MELQVGKAYKETLFFDVYILITDIQEDRVYGYQINENEKEDEVVFLKGFIDDTENLMELEWEEISIFYFLDEMKAIIGKIQSKYEKLKQLSEEK